jgi:AcrR family transcriptional regulator
MTISLSNHPRGSMRDEINTLKRERILDAAVTLFYERGYEKTTLDDIADLLGVRKPFIYYYYKSKSDLLSEICERGINTSMAALEKTLDEKGTASDRLVRLCRSFILAVISSQKHLAIFSREEKNLLADDHARISNTRREFDRKLTALLEEGRKKRQFSIKDARLTALAIDGVVSWCSVWYRPHGRLSAEAIADEMTELVMNLVGKRRPSAATPRRKASNGARAKSGK